MVQYTQYGLTHIDTVSSSTMASNYNLTVNDTSENYKFVIVTGSIQYDEDITGVPAWRLMVGTDPQSGRFRVLSSGTNNYGYSNSASQFNLNYYTSGNDNYTTLTGQMTHFIIELDYTNNGELASAPYKIRSARYQCFYYSGSNPHFSYGTVGFRETNDPADEINFRHTAGASITLNATSYGIGSITST